MTDHADLIARLEAATEGSRELDTEIAIFLGRGPITGHYPIDLHYTTSLDATIKLLPHGAVYVIHNMHEGKYIGHTILGYSKSKYDSFHTQVEAFAATPELSLCIVALKARSA